MNKVFSFIKNNSLLLLTLFFIAFIPLYPKLPLFDIKHTWVYIRIEDLLVAFAWVVFLIHLILKKASFKTPLTVPIGVFWLVGFFATLHGILFIFPNLLDVFPQIAVLHYLRRVEYLSFFFLAYSAMRNRMSITPIVVVLTATVIAIVIYGFGQRIAGFPAFLTMNEEFAKGIPLRLSPLSRVASTFAGHYDLAAYLIMVIPIMAALAIAYKKIWQKGVFIFAGVGALMLLLMTNSRVSFSVYIATITLLFILMKKKLLIIPVLLLSVFLLQAFPGISQRFAGTFTQVDLAVDSRTGKPIGIVKEGGEEEGKIIIEDKQSTGENLPQGSKYINFPSDEGEEFTSEIIYKKLKPGSDEEQIISSTGEIVVKKAFAYDVSFTTRLQGQWPRAVEAFSRNILIGSGYSSISLATDNNYLRILGEVGTLGFISFAMIFIVAGMYVWKILPDVKDVKSRALILGIVSGVVGLGMNAMLIDVFEASKVAFSLWILMGVMIAVLVNHQKKHFSITEELKKILFSPLALLFYLAVVVVGVFFASINNYFVGDDFTWLRWAADCNQSIVSGCQSVFSTIQGYFTQSQNFFYRPGTKTYFFLMYPLFELLPMPYHIVSILLHLSASSLIYFIVRKLLKSSIWAFVAALFFAVLSTHAEAIYWISVTGHLVTANLLLLSLLSYLFFLDKRNYFFLVFSWIAIFVATFFHEYAGVGPFILIATDLLFSGKKEPLKSKVIRYTVLLVPIVLYYFMRQSAQSVWFQGDYSYNLMKLPFNIVGNLIGYASLVVFGPTVLGYYGYVRTLSADNMVVVTIILVVVAFMSFVILKKSRKNISQEMITHLLFGAGFFILALLPFLGLGNIAPRYNYISSFGLIFISVVLLRATFVRFSKRSKDTAMATIVLVVVLFSFYHVQELIRVQSDWKKAGEMSNSMLVGLNYAYRGNEDDTSKVVKYFYFVNMPIRYNDAWVFPVGLEDALWFNFRNQDIRIEKSLSEEEALEVTKGNPNAHVFKFLENGDFVEVATPASQLNEE